MQQLSRMEIPVAISYIMWGIRITSVSAVGTMAIAAFVGANRLGRFIMLGKNSRNDSIILMGTVAVFVMALVLDFLLSQVEHGVISRGIHLQIISEISALQYAVGTKQSLPYCCVFC